MSYFDFAVIGGDRRLVFMIPILRSRGYRVITYKTKESTKEEQEAAFHGKRADSLMEAVQGAQAVILGIPPVRNGSISEMENISLQEFVSFLGKDQLIFGGAINKDQRACLLEKTNSIYDFLLDEKITIYNAVATAEGVVLEILRQRNTVLSGEKVLLFGFGRCGKNIALRLQGMRAKVFVATKNSAERSWAEAAGFEAFSLGEAISRISEMDFLVNTIPYPFLGKKQLDHLRKPMDLFEVASCSCLVDEETSTDALLHMIYLPGLPGKYAPKSLAEAYSEYVCEKWRELENHES